MSAGVRYISDARREAGSGWGGRYASSLRCSFHLVPAEEGGQERPPWVLDGFRKRFCGFVVEKMPTNIFLVVPSRIGRSLESHDRSTYLLATLGS